MLALIAGEGRLPVILMDRLNAEGVPCRLCELDGHPVGVDRRGATRFRLEHLGTLLSQLAADGVSEVCFAGRVHRPQIDPTEIDAATLPLVPRVMSAMQSGDDGALRAVLEVFEEAGFAILAAHEIAPDLLPEPGVATKAPPTADDRADAVRATRILSAMGSADLGQSCVVASGQVLAVEALPGTDWMLRSLIGERGAGWPTGGLLFKAPKSGQDRRVDLPVIGPDTITACADAGLRGVVIEAGGVMVLDRDDTIARADAAGMFLWVREHA